VVALINPVRNEKGLTLVEVLAVLVLTTIVLGFMIYLLNYSNTSLKQVSAREATLQQSSMIMNHIVGAVRKGLIPNPSQLNNVSQLTLIDPYDDGGQYVSYKLDTALHTLKAEYKLRDAAEDLPAVATSITFSDKVESIRFDAMDGKLTITLKMYLPNNAIHEKSTVVYTTLR
jgi:type II secretory pathway pseudopilin PulG